MGYGNANYFSEEGVIPPEHVGAAKSEASGADLPGLET